jgi:hypothetical protein
VPAGYVLAGSNGTEHIRYSGQVVDQRGQPIEGVRVLPSERIAASSAGEYGYGGEIVTTDRNGRFTIDGVPSRMDDDNPLRLEFRHPGFVYGRLEDLRLLTSQEHVGLAVTLRDGRSIAGRVVDSSGRPVIGALVESVYGTSNPEKPENTEARWDYDKFVNTDGDGKFDLRGLAAAPVVLQVRRFQSGLPLLWAQTSINLQLPAGPSDVELVAEPFTPSLGEPIHELFGMKLIDVDESIRKHFSLYSTDRVMILDPGRDADRLNIGRLEPGDAFWMVGESRINDFSDFAQRLLAECQAEANKGHSEFLVRVVYDYMRATDQGSNTQYMQLTSDDLAELRREHSR